MIVLGQLVKMSVGKAYLDTYSLPIHLQCHSYPINQFTIFVQERETSCKVKLFMYTVTDRLNTISPYLKTTAFGWELFLTGHLVGPGHSSKKKKKKKKSVKPVNSPQKSQNSFRNSKNPSFTFLLMGRLNGTGSIFRTGLFRNDRNKFLGWSYLIHKKTFPEK